MNAIVVKDEFKLPAPWALKLILEHLKHDAKNSQLCQITFVRGQDADVAMNNDEKASRLFDDEQIDFIVQQYIQLYNHVLVMNEAGFHIKQIALACEKTQNNAGIEFLSPKGKLFKHAYVNTPGHTTFIPNDFLHDLRMFPSRHVE